jgi:hypothetical protein
MRSGIDTTTWLRHLLLATVIACLASSAWAQLACDEIDEQCTVPGSGTCQADGTCRGTPKSNGTPCNDGNECTASDRCQNGNCVGGGSAAPGTPCTSPLGLCLRNPTCQFGFCFSEDFVECADSGDMCKPNFCDPRTGQCTSIDITCDDDCSTAQCDPGTGECVNPQPKNESQQCDDGMQCTTDDRCQAGECRGAVGTPGPAPSPTPTSTPVPPATATATDTPTFPGGTPPAGGCVGDCGGNGEVTVDEIIKGVNIALGNALLDECRNFDANGDGDITINELIQGVVAALTGCPTPAPTFTSAPVTETPTPVPATSTATTAPSAATAPPTEPATATHTSAPGATHTPTATETPTLSPTVEITPSEGPAPTVTPTIGGPSVPQRAAGAIQSTSTALLVLPNILSALLGHTGGLGSGSAAGFVIPIPFSCPGGGGGQVACSQEFIPDLPPRFGPPMYTVTLNNCTVAATGGTSLAFNGTLEATGREGDTCFTIPSALNVRIPDLTVIAQGSAGTTTATFTDVSGTITLSGENASCTYDTVEFKLTGSMRVDYKDATGAPLGSVQVGFGQGSSILINIEQYGNDCVPVIYNTTVQGGMTFSSDGNSFEAVFTDYVLHNDASSGNNLITVNGGIASDCFGGAVQLVTSTDLLLTAGVPCPRAGAVEVTSGAATDLVRYTNTGGVEIDLGNDGSINQEFASCLDARLFQCPVS